MNNIDTDILKNIIIENASISDLEEIYNIEKACFPIKEAATYQALKERIENFDDSFLIARYNSKIIAFINGAIINSDIILDEMFADIKYHNNKNYCQAIFGLDTLKEYREKGVASLLLKTFIKKAKQRGQKLVILTCKKHMLAYYAKFGFVNKGISKSEHGSATWYDMEVVL